MERTASCPSCGRGVFHGDAFCSWCGTPIEARSAETGKARQTFARKTIPTGERETCASCNSPVLPGDVFCSTCGARHGVDPAEGEFDGSFTGIPRRIQEASRGKYELIRELGRGGMGIVFMARDRELDRLVAIKVLSPSLLADEEMVERFQREARTIASLRHESIISVYDVGRTGDLHYFVMAFIEGVSLSRILRTVGALPIPVVEAVLYQVGSALGYAHRPGRGIIHRDVKPSNIMLDDEGLAVVMDFGISKVSEAASGLTRTGLVIGTPEYMSPEQCRGHTVTQASDQYSLGTVLFALLTGAPPFTGPFYRVLMAHQTEAVPSVLELRPDCPPALAEATERMLAKAPGDRWPSLRDALRALELRPLAHDDPALRQLAGLVEETVTRAREEAESAEGTERDDADGPDRPATSIRIIPVPEDLEIGDELGLSAAALFPDGERELGLDVNWESTDPAIVRVDASTGQLEAVGEGSAFVRAMGAGVSGSVAVEVKRPQVVRIALEPGEVTLEKGSTARLTAHPLSKRNDRLDRLVSWSSSDPRTVSVSADGVATGHAEGSAHILAHSEGVGAATTVQVTLDTGDAPSPGAAPGAPAAAEPDGARRAPARAPGLARVPASVWVGLAVALGLGGLWLGRGLLGVGEAERVAQVTILEGDQPVPADLRLLVGDTLGLAATPASDDGTPLDRPVAWSSTDPAVASVDAGGRLVALAGGTVRIQADADGVAESVAVTVESPPAEVVLGTADGGAVSDPVTLEPGESVGLSAAVLDAVGDVVPEARVEWTVSPASVASVDDGGVVVAQGPGQAQVTARAGGLESSVSVLVEEAASPPPPPPAEGTLVVQLLPGWADLVVDGVQRGEGLRSYTLSLPVGEHDLRLQNNPRLLPFDTTFTIRDGETTQLQLRLEERNEG